MRTKAYHLMIFKNLSNFEEYDEELFQCIDGYWEIPVDMKENLVSQLESGELTFEDAQQIQAYLEDR